MAGTQLLYVAGHLGMGILTSKISVGKKCSWEIVVRKLLLENGAR